MSHMWFVYSYIFRNISQPFQLIKERYEWIPRIRNLKFISFFLYVNGYKSISVTFSDNQKEILKPRDIIFC